jgi:putative Holliday junction resolvase
MRFLAVDLGAKRTGLAVGDDRTGVVSPLATIVHKEGSIRADLLRSAVEAHGPQALVIGLPLNMDGSEGPSASLARRTGSLLGEALSLPVHFHDERLTTFAADQALARSGRTRDEKKALRDGLAAAALLEEFLSARRRAAEPS